LSADDKTPFWRRLGGLLRKPEADHVSREEAIRLAAAVLLVEMARADAEHGEAERAALRRELEQRFGLEMDEAQSLVAVAEQFADQSVCMHGYIDDINTGLDYREKQSVLKMLWQVAYADGRLHHHEEHLMRRFADLLHLSHEDFIRMKLQVLGET
jgi:uncharacterized tellurite resistance protein B-like protein